MKQEDLEKISDTIKDMNKMVIEYKQKQIDDDREAQMQQQLVALEEQIDLYNDERNNNILDEATENIEKWALLKSKEIEILCMNNLTLLSPQVKRSLIKLLLESHTQAYKLGHVAGSEFGKLQEQQDAAANNPLSQRF